MNLHVICYSLGTLVRFNHTLY